MEYLLVSTFNIVWSLGSLAQSSIFKRSNIYLDLIFFHFQLLSLLIKTSVETLKYQDQYQIVNYSNTSLPKLALMYNIQTYM